ncbi:MAG TPA: lysylphosphatidylglycerol synthase domain-containing protein [Longimicrobiales bacterium]
MSSAAPAGDDAMATPPSHPWRRLFGWLLVVATLGFLALTIARQWDELSALEWRLEPLPFIGSIALLVATLGWGVWIWQRVLRRLGVAIALRPLLRIWFLATLARYVPGKIWQFVGAAQLARRYGVPAVPLVTSMVVHMGFTMAAAVILGTPLLAARLIADDRVALAVSVLVGLAVVVAVHPRPVNVGLDLLPRALHREVLRWEASWSYALLLLLWSVVSWIAYGAAFTLFAAAIFDVSIDAVPGLVAANAVAVLAGVLAVVAPAGLGARELALSFLLQPLLPVQGAGALLALLSRLWVMIGEVVGAGLSVLLAPIPRSQTSAVPPQGEARNADPQG